MTVTFVPASYLDRIIQERPLESLQVYEAREILKRRSQAIELARRHGFADPRGGGVRDVGLTFLE